MSPKETSTLGCGCEQALPRRVEDGAKRKQEEKVIRSAITTFTSMSSLRWTSVNTVAGMFVDKLFV